MKHTPFEDVKHTYKILLLSGFTESLNSNYFLRFYICNVLIDIFCLFLFHYKNGTC